MAAARIARSLGHTASAALQSSAELGANTACGARRWPTVPNPESSGPTSTSSPASAEMPPLSSTSRATRSSTWSTVALRPTAGVIQGPCPAVRTFRSSWWIYRRPIAGSLKTTFATPPSSPTVPRHLAGQPARSQGMAAARYRGAHEPRPSRPDASAQLAPEQRDSLTC